MSAFAAIFLLVNTAALMLLARNWAALPLLDAACYLRPG
jgi:hypothetical protein